MIVHIGFHKTGTTFLQKKLFPSLDGINYKNYAESEILLKSIYDDTTVEYKNSDSQTLNLPENTLLSYEGLVGKFCTGHYSYEIALRLKQAGVTKILITIRRRDKMLESLYRQYVQLGGVLSASNFIKSRKYFRWSYLDYRTLINHYIDLFGNQNVLVLCQEELNKDIESVIKKLENFLPVRHTRKKVYDRENRSLSFWSIHLLRFVNYFTYHHYSQSHLVSKKITTWKFRYVLQQVIDPFLRKMLGDRNFFSDDFKKTVKRKYARDNRELNRQLELDMEKYGYPCE
jgi:hypothetical protein